MSPSSNSPAARRPSKLTYNDLNGREAYDILMEEFGRLLRSHPLFSQQHLTLPNVRLTLDVKVGIDMHIGGTVPVESAPVHEELTGRLVFEHELSEAMAALADETSLRLAAEQAEAESERKHLYQSEVNAAPVPGGKPPDQIRALYGLPVPKPGYGPRDTGSHLFLADVLTGAPEPRRETGTDPIVNPSDEQRRTSVVPPFDPATGGRRGEVAQGYQFSSEVVNVSPTEQHMPADNGEIAVEFTGRGIQHESGMTVRASTHKASVKVQGDEKGKPYGGVNGVYDPGPRGLMNPNRGGGGYGTDGRPRMSFGNDHRGR